MSKIIFAKEMLMIKYTLSVKSLMEQQADAYVLCLPEDFAFSKELRTIAQDYFPSLENLIERRKFTGKAQSSLIIQMHKDDKPCSLILLGVGKKEDKKVEHYRRALGVLVRLSEQHEIKTIALQLPSSAMFGVTPEQLGQETSIILPMAAYYFDDFFTEKKQKDFDITLVVDAKHKITLKKGVDAGIVISDAVNEARHWIDLPPEKLTPIELAGKAKKIAKKNGLKMTEFTEKEIIKKGMGGLAGVGQGSDRDAHLVILEYKAKNKNAETICFVGKGITFDSGGLSLKPPQYMETMKEDMSGAAAVLAAIDALAQLKPSVNIVVVMPLSENLPSGKATKPGDVLKFYNGKTAEVLNTDAEGRLILGDALAYAEKHYDLDALVDVATLTGSCAYALGPFFTGMLSQDAALSKKVQNAADRTGDRVWPLPFDNDYAKAVESKVADICNIGNPKYKAGAIMAAFFLKHFVEKTPWVHLDIAGTAFDVPDIPYYRTGATGSSVRLLIDLARNWK